MIRTNTLAIALAGAFAIGTAGPLYGQTDQEPMAMMGMMRDCPMMMGMTEGPGTALQHADTLNLTSEQITRLESLRDETRDTRRAAMARMGGIHDEIAAATAGDTFDEAAVRDAFRRMSELHEDLAVTTLRARHETSRVLTADQREMQAGLRAGGMSMMGSMEGMEGMMEMMENCPMMRHGMGHGEGNHGHMPRQKEGG